MPNAINRTKIVGVNTLIASSKEEEEEIDFRVERRRLAITDARSESRRGPPLPPPYPTNQPITGVPSKALILREWAARLPIIIDYASIESAAALFCLYIIYRYRVLERKDKPEYACLKKSD
ncbi:hypothetical protein Ddc_13351 [Ditylenchus destructor]|nr:hypothetical protein Ddc_13351 [Ditylenchus destructor]